MPKIKINDISMYYEIHGKGDAIVFIPGFSTDHLGWATVLDQFSKHYQVILLDNRGSGQTDAPKGPYSISQMGKDVADLCHALNISSAHFVGNSMGGYIVQTLAHQFPSLVKSVVISNSAMKTQTPFHIYVSAHLDLIKANAPLTFLMKAMCAWAFSYDFLCKPGMLDNLLEWGKNNPYPMTMIGYEGQFAALDGFDSSRWVNEIDLPTLVLTADQDLIFSSNLSKALENKIKYTTYHCFTNCGHLPHIEQPEHYFNTVKSFLDNLP